MHSLAEQTRSSSAADAMKVRFSTRHLWRKWQDHPRWQNINQAYNRQKEREKKEKKVFFNRAANLEECS